MNFPRAYFSLLTIGDAFVAIGGVTNDGYTAEVEVFFNYTKAWSRQDSDLSLGTARSSFATLLLPSTPSEYAGKSLFFFFLSWHASLIMWSYEVGSSTEDKLTFEENGETLVQEQIITEETGILGDLHLQKHFLMNVYLQRYTSPRTAATLSRCTWCRKGKFYWTRTSPASWQSWHRISAKGL